MRCSYCYVDPYSGTMTPETARAVVDLAGRDAKRVGLIFFGGEPLLLRDLITETVAYARKKEQKNECRYFFKITTNGLLLDDDFIDFSRREGILRNSAFATGRGRRRARTCPCKITLALSGEILYVGD